MAFAKFRVKQGVKIGSSGTTPAGDLIPVGLIIPWTNSTAPDGWLMCDGTAVSSTIYPTLWAHLQSLTPALTTTPNLVGHIVMGVGTGVGAGSSGTGLISGSNLSPRSLGVIQPSSTHPAIDFSHSHTYGAHTHNQPHTHAYPHTHSINHDHTNGHNHGTSADGSHTHTGFYTAQYTTGPGQALRGSGSLAAGGDSDGLHTHPIASTTPTTDAGSTSFGSLLTPDFGASPTTNTAASATTTTTSVGSGSTFSVAQPTMAVYYIIKY